MKTIVVASGMIWSFPVRYLSEHGDFRRLKFRLVAANPFVYGDLTVLTH
jgi:hypothetical protein